jgi:hypothetical protein
MLFTKGETAGRGQALQDFNLRPQTRIELRLRQHWSILKDLSIIRIFSKPTIEISSLLEHDDTEIGVSSI